MRKKLDRDDRLRAHRRAERRSRARSRQGSQAGIVRTTFSPPVFLSLPPARIGATPLPGGGQERSWWRRVFRRAA